MEHRMNHITINCSSRGHCEDRMYIEVGGDGAFYVEAESEDSGEMVSIRMSREDAARLAKFLTEKMEAK